MTCPFTGVKIECKECNLYSSYQHENVGEYAVIHSWCPLLTVYIMTIENLEIEGKVSDLIIKK
jgi:hypothetical protein